MACSVSVSLGSPLRSSVLPVCRCQRCTQEALCRVTAPVPIFARYSHVTSYLVWQRSLKTNPFYLWKWQTGTNPESSTTYDGHSKGMIKNNKYTIIVNIHMQLFSCMTEMCCYLSSFQDHSFLIQKYMKLQ